MADSIDSVSDEEFRRQLLWLRTNYGTVVDSQRLGRLIRGFKSQKGIYKPTGSPYALGPTNAPWRLPGRGAALLR